MYHKFMDYTNNVHVALVQNTCVQHKINVIIVMYFLIGYIPWQLLLADAFDSLQVSVQYFSVLRTTSTFHNSEQ